MRKHSESVLHRLAVELSFFSFIGAVVLILRYETFLGLYSIMRDNKNRKTEIQ